MSAGDRLHDVLGLERDGIPTRRHVIVLSRLCVTPLAALMYVRSRYSVLGTT